MTHCDTCGDRGPVLEVVSPGRVTRTCWPCVAAYLHSDPPVHPPDDQGEECDNCGYPVDSDHCTCDWEDEAYDEAHGN